MINFKYSKKLDELLKRYKKRIIFVDGVRHDDEGVHHGGEGVRHEVQRIDINSISLDSEEYSDCECDFSQLTTEKIKGLLKM